MDSLFLSFMWCDRFLRNRYSFSDAQNILSSAKCPSVSSMSNTIVFFLIGIHFDDIIFVCDFFSVIVLYFFGRTYINGKDS